MDVDLASHQVLEHLVVAAVGDERQMRSGFPLKNGGDQALPGRGGSSRHVRIGLEPGNQFGQVPRRYCLFRIKKSRVRGQRRDRREAVEEVIVQRIEGAVEYMTVDGSKFDRVTIRLCPSSAARTDAAIRAAYVFNNDRLPKPLSHPFCDDSSGHVGWAARSEGYDHGDRARRIGLRARVTRNGRKSDSAGCET